MVEPDGSANRIHKGIRDMLVFSDLLLAIYCHEEHKERVSISRVRELRIKIRNELLEILADIKEQDDCMDSS